MTTLATTSVPAASPAGSEDAAGLAIWTRGLTKRYGDRTVVDHVGLEVPAGVVCGFVGPNGAGKTTTIRMLLGLVRPTAGGGTVLDRPLERPTAYLGEVGALIEGPAFTPALSGADNLAVLARAGRLPLRRVAEVLDRVGLGGRGGDRYRSYSLGMKQRLGIAAALLPEPRLLVLDEPTNGLDPAGIAQMRELIASFRDEGMTVLVSSHLLAEIEQVADHLVLIRAGKVAFQGPVETLVRSRPPHLLLTAPDAASADLVADIAAALDLPATTSGPQEGRPGRDVAVELDPAADDAGAQALAAELNRRAHASGVVLARLELRRPTLEEAFLELTGTASGDVR
jgi:ABC-2 type transport system ATP-binding protein